MAKRKLDLKPMSIKLPTQLKTRLNKLGKLKQRTPHWLMKEAIENYLNEEEQTEKLKQETIGRWQEAEQEQFVENNRIISWLETWGKDKEQGRPECR